MVRPTTIAVMSLLLVAVAAPAEESMTRIERETHLGWPDTYRLSNGAIEVRVVTAVGPRIVDVRLAGGENILYMRPAEAGGRGEAEWMFRGGWRLWVSPEVRESTYALDNAACEVETAAGMVRVTGPAQPEAGIRKSVEVALDGGEPRVRVTGRIRNVADGPRTYAAWSLPVLRPGGRAFVPLDVGTPGAFDAVRRLILWSYARFSDPRYAFGDRLVQIDHARVPAPAAGQSGRRDDESKIGTDSRQGWAAYLLGETLFLKRWRHEEGERTDGGATIEVYSSHEFLELEHLGPLRTIAPGEEIVLEEEWTLVGGIEIPRDEEGALAALAPVLR